jgi:protein TonB
LIYDHLLRALPDMPVERVLMSTYEAGALLVFAVRPEYPEEARRQGIVGTVRLHAIIGKDGSVKKLDVISGQPLLNAAAQDAVRQWRYRPARLNGEAAEMDTEVDVMFNPTH